MSGTRYLNLSRETKLSGVNGDRKKKNIFPVELTTSGIDNLTRLIHTLPKVKVLTIHATAAVYSTIIL